MSTRRGRVTVAAMALAAIALGAIVIPIIASSPSGAPNVTPGGSSVGLRVLARRRHRAIGTAIATPASGTDPRELALVAREYSSITPENAMKWNAIHPERDRFDFTAADATVAFAAAHDMTVRGHTLVWYRDDPAWLTSGHFDRARLIEILRDHIHTVVGHFRGRVQQWDVVNEALAPGGHELRDDVWRRGIGPEYVALAFRFAHEADPDARLFLNDYGTDTANAKSNALYHEAVRLRAQGVPIDGVGFQMHRSLTHPESRAAIESNLRRFSDAGFEVWITELDVALRLPADANELAGQARIAGDTVAACLAVPRCGGITTWGFTDRHSWIPSAKPGFGAALPFDEHLAPKPAYAAMAAAFLA